MQPQSLPLTVCLSDPFVRPGAAQSDSRHPIRTSGPVSRSRLVRFHLGIVMGWITFTACGSDEPPGPPLEPQVEPPPLIFTSLTAGTDKTCGVTTDDDAYCWGGLTGSSGGSSIGSPSTTGSDVPIRVAGGISFQSVVAGGDQTCGLATTGLAYCWGLEGADELTAGRPAEVPGLHIYVSVSNGTHHTCGITMDGDAYCWGLDGGGRLGDGSNAGSETPVAVLGGLRFTSVSVGGNHSCGITESGTTYCWGANEHGRLGDGTAVDRTAPVEVLTTAVFASIDAGILHTCAISLSGAVYCWGFNGTGQLGDGTTTTSAVPVQISGGHTFASVVAGGGHSCAVTTDGTAYCWGHDRNGQLGDGLEEETQSTVPVLMEAALVFRSLSAGLAHTCGVTTDSVAYCWGLNSFGQLGIGSTTNADGSERVSGT